MQTHASTVATGAWIKPARIVRRAMHLAARLARVALRWHELARQRRALLRLDDRMLKDIGISRADAVGEASRPFWDEGGDPWRHWH
jgi:uncharacterized protein YjiS (DUF1127 family)